MDEPHSSQDGVPKSKFTYRHLNALSSSTPPKDSPLRCVVLIDLDCFYAQVEQVRLGIPKDEPLAVQQWQQLTSAAFESTPARKFGMGRHITATDARKLCPNIHLAHVQTWQEGDSEPRYHPNPKVQTHKVSLDPYRRASLQILEIFRSHCDRIEKASIDESFLDLSSLVKTKLLERYPELSLPPPYNDTSYNLPPAPSVTFTDGHGAIVPLSEGESEEDPVDWDDVVMYIAAEMIREVRKEVEEKLGYTCSAGIARNKMLAKLAAGWKKPNQQTVLRNRAIMGFMKDFKFTKIRNLGGKFGAEVASVFDTDQVSDILNFSADQLRAKLGQEQGSWVYNTIRGIDYSEVNTRTKIKSMLSAKNFQPPINNTSQAERWLRVLTADLANRLSDDEDHRLPRTLTIHHRSGGHTKSRQAPLPLAKEMDKDFLFNNALSIWRAIEAEGRAFPAINVSVGLSGFGDGEDRGRQGIQGFLVPGKKAELHPGISGASNGGGGTGGTEVLGKRKRDDEGIAKFFGKKEDTHSPSNTSPHPKDDSPDSVGPPEEDIVLPDEQEQEEQMETYLCPNCQKQISIVEMEIHEDYHVALELSRGSPIRAGLVGSAGPTGGAKGKVIPVKKGRKEVKKEGRGGEKGQMKLQFGV